MPEVAVVIPHYNRQDLALRAVDSVLAQEGCSFELLLVDDGSSEDTSVLRARVESEGQRFLKLEHGGVSAARNHGVAQSSAKYIAFLDSDDLWLAGKLQEQREFHRDNPKCRISQTTERWVRKGVRVNACAHHEKPDGEFFEAALARCCISPSAVMMERALFDALGGFDERFVVCEDYDLWLRASVQEEVGLVATELLEKYGGHSDQLSQSQVAMDRFRICSMLQLGADSTLNPEREELLRKSLQSKSEILAAGARKRSNTALVTLLEEILEVSHLEMEQWREAMPDASLLLESVPRVCG